MMGMHTMYASTLSLIAALMLAAPGLAYSQTGYVVPGSLAPRDPLPRFTIAPHGGAPAPIGIPSPGIGPPPAPITPNAPTGRRFRRFSPFAPVRVFYVPQPVAAPPPPPMPKPRTVAVPAPGRLVLDVEPATAQ